MRRLGCGFNLLELFSWGGSQGTGFRKADFELAAAWGFRFLRLPADHRYLWRDGAFDEAGWEAVDAAVRLGARTGIHVNLNLHRAPGFCINTPRERWTLWTDEADQRANAEIWRFAAARYRGEGDRVSFDLVNEPTGCDIAVYEAFVRRMVAEIRGVDPARPIVADGHEVGTVALAGLADLGIAQSVHCYAPHWLTHYRAPWVYRTGDPYAEPPAWPGREPPRRDAAPADAAERPLWDRQRLARWLEPWVALQSRGVLVHCGEFGVYTETPRAAQLAWSRDLVDLLRERDIDWALWNLQGAFGVVETGRAGVAWQAAPDGRRFDAELLDILRPRAPA